MVINSKKEKFNWKELLATLLVLAAILFLLIDFGKRLGFDMILTLEAFIVFVLLIYVIKTSAK